MRFYTRKRRQPPAVIIVALIDVLIVVLIFLMVTTTFKKPQQQALRLVLPESSQATKTGATETPPLIVYIEEKGTLRFGPDATPVTVDHLKTELMAEAAKNPAIRVAISADKNAPWGQVVRVMDAAKEANLKYVNASIKPAGKN